MKWRVYYADGSTFDSSQGSEEAAPGDGVVCIVQPARGGREVMCRWDWYYWHGTAEEWWGSDIHGLLYQLTHDPEGVIRAVKQGAMVKTDWYDELTKRASNDPDFPPLTRREKRSECRGFR
jgi:hypothetical protein